MCPPSPSGTTVGDERQVKTRCGLIANRNGPGRLIVRSKSSDKAFETSNCGDWTRA